MQRSIKIAFFFIVLFFTMLLLFLVALKSITYIWAKQLRNMVMIISSYGYSFLGFLPFSAANILIISETDLVQTSHEC